MSYNELLNQIKSLSSEADKEENVVEQITVLLNTYKQSEDEPSVQKETLRKQQGSKPIAFSEYSVQHGLEIVNPANTWKYSKVTKYTPQSLKGLVEIIKTCEDKNKKVRAIGSKHSFSLAPAIKEGFIDMTAMVKYSIENHNKTLSSLPQGHLDLLKDALNKDSYIDILGGVTIRQLNHILCPDVPTHKLLMQERKKMFNMGGGDVQTITGALSTGTHGSGGKYAAYHDKIGRAHV